jgi:ribonuclease H / adenosylcobalamin/alpha-ribazole phosphatase
MANRWPSVLWLVRHGQSAGNVARDAAEQAGAERIALVGRDVDVPLSALGERQAVSLGRWFAEGLQEAQPEVLLSSPYVRAIQTAERFRAAGGCEAHEPIHVDERLREKEFGILDGLTVEGIRKYFPEQAQFRDQLGKFYHRVPGGESWTDVILRLRSLLDTVSLHYAGRRVMIFGHQVVVLCMRYILENMDEAGVLAVDKAGDIANCSITEYRFDASAGRNGNMRLVRYNETAPGEETTAERDHIVAARG